jgi:hypothetical protein
MVLWNVVFARDGNECCWQITPINVLLRMIFRCDPNLPYAEETKYVSHAGAGALSTRPQNCPVTDSLQALYGNTDLMKAHQPEGPRDY